MNDERFTRDDRGVKVWVKVLKCYFLGEEPVYEEESENIEESEGNCRDTLEIPMGLVAERMWVAGDRGATDVADSEAVLRIFFLRARDDLDVSAPLPPLLEDGLRAGANVGRISLAISRTRTAWSSLLSLETRS